MKRSLFFLLLSLPFLLVDLIKDDPRNFLVAAFYIWLLQYARLLYVGVSWKRALLAFTPFGTGIRIKMWQKDPAVIG